MVRHPIVGALLERYQDDYKLGELSAEQTLSMWLEKQEYEDPKTTSTYFYNLRN